MLNINAKSYSNKFISIYSDIISIDHNKTIIFSGHVSLKNNNNIIYSDKLILRYTVPENNQRFLIKIVAIGHIRFFNKTNKITGDKLKLYFNTNNIHISNHFNIVKIKKYNNLYNIVYNIDNIFITNGKLYLCSINNNSIIICGSKIVYNYYDKVINIRHAKIKLNNIPIFYSPHLSFVNNKLPYFNILLPKINYNSKGIELNIPHRLLSNFHSYEIITIPSIKQGIFNLKNKFNYLYKNYHGLVEFYFIPNQNRINNNLWLLYWSNTLKKNNYQLDIIYNKSNNFNFIKSLNINNYLNNNIIKKYYFLINKNNFNSDILYEKFLTKDNNYYDINSLINFYYYKNLYNKLIHFSILGQFNKYTNNNSMLKYFYITSKLNYIIRTNKLGILNSSFNLNTLYKNRDINNSYYSKINNLLNNKYIYVLPKIDISWYMIAKLYINNYTQIIKPIIEYKYDILNNNFNYDNFDQNKFIYLSNSINKDRFSNHYLFEGFKTLLFNKNIEKLYLSLGMIQHILPNYNKIINNIWFNQNITNFKNKLAIDNNVEFTRNINNIVLNNTNINFKFKNTRLLTINYYYLNLKYLNINKSLSSLEHKIGVNFSWLINKNWTINSQNNFNIKNININNQIINIKYKNCHFNFIIKYEYESSYNKIHDNLAKKNNNHISFSIGTDN
ncbi:MAG: hypothetical protein N4P90_00520 [Candidatus Lightella neohaematopini]|nr:hypothetical protein [Candidatus Lightella neohaematopini]